MDKMIRAIPPREIAKWCTFALVLLAPGSFVFLPLLWLARHRAARIARDSRFAAANTGADR